MSARIGSTRTINFPPVDKSAAARRIEARLKQLAGDAFEEERLRQ